MFHHAERPRARCRTAAAQRARAPLLARTDADYLRRYQDSNVTELDQPRREQFGEDGSWRASARAGLLHERREALELRGDVHRANGDTQAALDAYQRALDLAESGVGYRPLLEMKIEALGAEPNAAAERSS